MEKRGVWIAVSVVAVLLALSLLLSDGLRLGPRTTGVDYGDDISALIERSDDLKIRNELLKIATNNPGAIDQYAKAQGGSGCGTNVAADIDGNGIVDVQDLVLVILNWGGCDEDLRVFTTSITQKGDFGGLAQGDEICNNLAETSPLTSGDSEWVAWLSDEDVFAIDRLINEYGSDYVLAGNNELIASDKEDLIDGAISHSINLDEHGNPIDGSVFTWTGTEESGVYESEFHCHNWGNQATIGRVGWLEASDDGWTDQLFQACNSPLHLYCFEQEQCGGEADVNSDGLVNTEDLIEVILSWGPVCECTDGFDNDFDSLVDCADPGCWIEQDPDACDASLNDESLFTSQCQDGIDNDLDGFIDFPEDLECDSLGDNDESGGLQEFQCFDGIDNDNDGFIDFPEDLECDSPEDNSEGEFTEVCAASDLDAVRNDLLGNYKQVCDIDLQNMEIEPIGTPSNPFLGVYDGNNHTISNYVYINPELDHVGLFGRVGASPTVGGVIKNIVLEDFNVEGRGNVGSIVGMAFGSTLSDVTVRNGQVTGQQLFDEIDGPPFNPEPYTGGLVGHLHPGSHCLRCAVENVHVEGKTVVGGLVGSNHGTIMEDSYTLNSTVDGDGQMVGGLIGWTQFDQIVGIENHVKNSHVENVDVKNLNLQGEAVGGLIGWMDPNSRVENSYSIGGEVKGEDTVGGLVGYMADGAIEGSYSTYEVRTSSFNQGEKHGGLVGYVENSEITESYATGNVRGHDYLGGFVGYLNASTINNCYTDGPHAFSDDSDEGFVGGFVGYTEGSLIDNSHSNRDVVGGTTYVGGFAGYVIGETTIQNSYATGVVNGSLYVGGFAGALSIGNVIKSYSTGNVNSNNEGEKCGGLVGHFGQQPPNTPTSLISDSYSIGDVSCFGAVFGAGGLVGYNVDHLDGVQDAIVNSYSTGSVSSDGPRGGFIGRAGDLTITHSYWDTQTSGIQNNCGTGHCEAAAGAEGRTTEEMTSVPRPDNTYVDWAFGSIWDQDDGSYPYLI